MSKWLYAIGGALFGSAVSYFITRHYYEKEIQDILDEQDEVYLQGLAEGRNKPAQEKTITELSRENAMGEYVDAAAEYDTEPDDISEEEEEDIVTDQELDNAVEKKARKKAEKPYIIDEVEYAEEMAHYDKLSLNYYDGDNVITDEEDEMLDDEYYMLGDINVRHEFNKTDNDAIYIRNDRIEADIEIVFSYLSYHKDVLGMEE